MLGAAGAAGASRAARRRRKCRAPSGGSVIALTDGGPFIVLKSRLGLRVLFALIEDLVLFKRGASLGVSGGSSGAGGARRHQDGARRPQDGDFNEQPVPAERPF